MATLTAGMPQRSFSGGLDRPSRARQSTMLRASSLTLPPQTQTQSIDFGLSQLAPPPLPLDAAAKRARAGLEALCLPQAPAAVQFALTAEDGSLPSDTVSAVLERLQDHIAARGVPVSRGINVVALSGSTRSALALFLVASVFDDNTVACISSAEDLDAASLQRVHFVADLLGIEVWELDVHGAPIPLRTRVAVQPGSQLPVERSVAAFLGPITAGAAAAAAAAGAAASAVFAGVGTDHLGAACAAELGVVCPLAGLPQAWIAALARAVGLPDWGHVAHAQDASAMREARSAAAQPARQLVAC